ncbi:MAG: hypothetical protein HC912_05560 [Saprospiraceae bacterium]|nr:hypothetical protein [Saprospiraceae bacterium]
MKNRLLFVIVFLPLLWACNKEEILLTENIQLTFSTDTLRFDTVFTELGSATRILKVYNNENQRIRLDRIAIESGSGISFRMNVDGISGKEVLNVEIAANDSLYIFAEVTVNPDQDISVSPFVGEGRIIFETKDNRQEVMLEAWGQNANYLPNRFARGTFSVVSDFTMNDPKPYVIYGGLFVERGTLTIPAGARVHVHGGLARSENTIYNDGFIWVLGTGRIKIEGTLENPVIIQGNRLEKEFEAQSGQWTGIFIDKNSKGNTINFATIKIVVLACMWTPLLRWWLTMLNFTILPVQVLLACTVPSTSRIACSTTMVSMPFNWYMVATISSITAQWRTTVWMLPLCA